MSFSFCWTQVMLIIFCRGDIHHGDICMGCTTAIKPLRIHKCATSHVDALLTPTSPHWLSDAPWLGGGATVTVSWPTRSAPYPLMNVKWPTSLACIIKKARRTTGSMLRLQIITDLPSRYQALISKFPIDQYIIDRNC
ncbi:uncharacterized protein BJ212DRAFT_1380080 [Suillus subaureus]|uniref:Secreted protein n=1 Tax=Suillus subaureus TaxID=48587 RepID=A0A9P7J9B0_9AGAM|nr:uncharacterized protein BJ212DRAFT_1380080 [Suillus subaureus]KAG1809443.1 hypothetical protein BJ212DRAFT_1380080 [Suillus subaureus]